MSIPETERVLTPPNLLDTKISRRDLLKGIALVAGAFTTLAGVKKMAGLVESGELEGGIRLLPPKLDVEIKNIYKENFQTSNILVRFSDLDKELGWVHRANSVEDINRAFEKGARVFDIDANAVYETDTNGQLYEKVYAEHGLFRQVTISGRKINFVCDPNELEVTTAKPPTLEELIKHIHSLSTPGHPLAVSIHFKYGQFEEKTLQKTIDILDELNMPAELIPWSEFTDQDTVRKRLRKILAGRKDVV